MIASLTGVLVEVLLDGAIIDVQGVGYRVYMPASSLVGLGHVGSTTRVHTHLHVREDAMTVFAFATNDARELFTILLGVNSVGPKAALQILSVFSPEQLRRAVATEDIDALTVVPGIGKKTAARMILELREKLSVPDLSVVPGGSTADRAALVEVKGALLSLGYSPAEARDAVERIDPDEDADVQGLLRLALRELARA